ncbi:hypothetical protein GUITHDRAFT_116458 [Guillardia theta CCMP2712]|uniref:IBB domain-containing protein n=1 Tax=Guillardia theta (strain CCMP2712) TaxID=905079 RepID=L1IN88_GUITC|nr:hypothetical protein GUITHDRAFT_116458 [Guillardia theta CCMP2712]EKX37344.1 hypothetical protein GUITHDRAFT_116458 [Guillardia theta CCMP2712]|eukprot:XP_005824324.1 hypothetical protein GUITHDRAFT_116458 [Guillardia theta CCMP2712]
MPNKEEEFCTALRELSGEDPENAIFRLAEMMTESDDYQASGSCCFRTLVNLLGRFFLVKIQVPSMRFSGCARMEVCVPDDRPLGFRQQQPAAARASSRTMLVEMADNDDLPDDCRANVAWALGSLANESEENRRSIGSIPEAMNALVKVACCSSDEARERAAYSIAEVVRDNEENRVSLANTEGSIAALVHICATGSDPGKEQAAWALAMLAENSEDNCSSIVLTPFALEALLEMISSPESLPTDKLVSANALYAIAELARVARWALDQLLSDYDDEGAE